MFFLSVIALFFHLFKSKLLSLLQFTSSKSANHVSLLAAFPSLFHLYPFMLATIIFPPDHCHLLSSCCHSSPLQFNLHIITRSICSKQETPTYSKYGIKPTNSYIIQLLDTSLTSSALLIIHLAALASVYSSVPQLCQVHCKLRTFAFLILLLECSSISSHMVCSLCKSLLKCHFIRQTD